MYRVKFSSVGGGGSAATFQRAKEALTELNKREAEGQQDIEVYMRDGKLIDRASLEELARKEFESQHGSPSQPC